MDKNYYSSYHRDKDYLGFEKMFSNIFAKRFLIIKKLVNIPGKVLDVGCSTGAMLDIFKKEGWETWGVEPSESNNSAKRKGHTIINSFFENAKIPFNSFDVAVLNHTLEHMDSPVDVLKKVNNILKSGGIVLVDVPNAGGISSKIMGKYWPYRLPEEHKHQFTKQSLENVFKNAGFRVVHFESRSALFEFADPIKELFDSLISLKKRFFINLITLPYAFLVTIFNSGDSMSMVGKKEG